MLKDDKKMKNFGSTIFGAKDIVQQAETNSHKKRLKIDWLRDNVQLHEHAKNILHALNIVYRYYSLYLFDI